MPLAKDEKNKKIKKEKKEKKKKRKEFRSCVKVEVAVLASRP